MSTQTETASEYLMVASKAADRGAVRDALYHIDRAQELLLREQSQVSDVAAQAGDLIGESYRYAHLGKVLAEKARRRF